MSHHAAKNAGYFIDRSKKNLKCLHCRRPFQFYLERLNEASAINEEDFPRLEYLTQKQHQHCPVCKQLQL